MTLLQTAHLQCSAIEKQLCGSLNSLDETVQSAARAVFPLMEGTPLEQAFGTR